ncbi:helix-turn-helix domain-containing protein [Kribbella sp. DT2]|uniref:helix-turn-helix domain-containing protein n=1 Tax=Kribbella sp. DT2 TaxID=3393427 RepID=UPI003CEAC104
MNDALRRAMYAAGLGEVDIAARLDVDPKTVRRWMNGRLPHPRHRQLLAQLFGFDEPDLWPELMALPGGRGRSAEMAAIYPQRNAVGRESWLELFEAADEEIGVLAYSALFLAEDRRMIRLLEAKAEAGVDINLALGNPDGEQVAQRGRAEKIGDAMAAKIRNALVLYRPLLRHASVSLRLHDTILYNSMFRADDQLLINQHVFGVPAARAPVFDLRRHDGGEMFAFYLESFAEIWSSAEPVDGLSV